MRVVDTFEAKGASNYFFEDLKQIMPEAVRFRYVKAWTCSTASTRASKVQGCICDLYQIRQSYGGDITNIGHREGGFLPWINANRWTNTCTLLPPRAFQNVLEETISYDSTVIARTKPLNKVSLDYMVNQMLLNWVKLWCWYYTIPLQSSSR